MAISSKAQKVITELIDFVVKDYVSRASQNPKKDSGNPFTMALLEDFEPITHRLHGLRTSLGNQMEKIAEVIAKDAWGAENIKRKTNRDIQLPRNVFQTIDSILNRLSNSLTKSSYTSELKEIYDSCKNPSNDFENHTYEFDLEINDVENDNYHFLEMKGPDPNTTEVPGAKKRLLVEFAWGILNLKSKKVDAAFAIYYNNVFPRPYNNPKVMYYFENQGLLVHDAFWNFIGKDKNTFKKLVKIFNNYGNKNKKMIWDAFSQLVKVNEEIAAKKDPEIKTIVKKVNLK